MLTASVASTARALALRFAPLLTLAAITACSSSDAPASVSGTNTLTPLGGGDAGPLVFGTTAAVSGAQDSHCGSTAQSTSAASCHPDGGGEGNVPPGGGYGATMYGASGSDDDCKYDVSWASTVIVENTNVWVQIKATKRTDHSALTGAAPVLEIFRTVDNDPGPASNGSQKVSETSPGTYLVGPVQFDAPTDGGTAATDGYWTMRIHFNESCADVLPDSPHGHAAFYVQVP